jgi:uncharacterized protein (TIGR02646 family)
MIHVRRLAEPDVLRENKDAWRAALLAQRAAKPGSRPRQYAHKDVVGTLEAMSHGKCFYCEAPGARTVDHYIEIAEQPELAFEWTNLYLACGDCQNKQPNRALAAADCVDPCDEAADPRDHLDFDDEIVSFRTTRGEATVKKYRLKRVQLERARARELIRFLKEMASIGKPWAEMTANEHARLEVFARDDAPFALMFRCHLAKVRPGPDAV